MFGNCETLMEMSAPPPLFPPPWRKKKGKQIKLKKKKRVSKQKLLKGCKQGQTVTVLAIPERHSNPITEKS